MLFGLTMSLCGCPAEPITEENLEISLEDGGIEPSELRPAPALGQHRRERTRPPAAPDLAPALSALDIEAKRPWSLQGSLDPSGKSSPGAVLLAFLGPSCPPCLESLPALRALEIERPEIEIVTLLLGEEHERQALAAQIRAARIEGPVVSADPPTAEVWLGSKRAPLYVFVARSGQITSRNERFDAIVRGWLPSQAQRALR